MKRLVVLLLATVVVALVPTTANAWVERVDWCLDGIDAVPAANQSGIPDGASPACGARGGVCVEGPGPGNSGNTPAADAGPNK